MSDDLPNLGLLIKLLKMTSSSNDGEVLVAIRKANEQLAKFGGDWETLLRGKVTVIGDPFADLAARPQRSAPPPPPPKPRAQPTWTPPPVAPQPRPKPQPAPVAPQFAAPSFTKDDHGFWVVRSAQTLPLNAIVDVPKRNGQMRPVEIKAHAGVNKFGDHLYRFIDKPHSLDAFA